MQQPKILLLDIETAPHLGYMWGLFKQNVGLNQVKKTGYIMSWAAKWMGNKKVYYADTKHGNEGAERGMLLKLQPLLEEADIVIGHNGDGFDMKWIRGRFLYHRLPIIPPMKQIDTLKIAKGQFRLMSNKLEHIADLLGVAPKEQHKAFPGFELWAECIQGNGAAWKEMKSYNKQDVITLEAVYIEMLPWAKAHPNIGNFIADGEMRCTKCGSADLHKRGFAYTNVGKFQRYQCQDCGGWSRDRTSIHNKGQRGALLMNIA